MTTETTLLFVLFAGFAAYVHTISGFALGMIIMGAATALELTSVPVAAAVVSLVTLVNGLFALPGSFHKIYWRGTTAAMLGILPAMVLGVLLLNFFTETAYQILKLLLGVTILSAAIHQIVARATQKQVSNRPAYFISGILGGLFGGLFGIAGPPLIYHYYRQPQELAFIRNGLIMLFVFTSATRTLFIGIQGQLDNEILILTAFTIPIVALATLLGRYYPPRISETSLRLFVIVILTFIGINLIVEAVLKL